MKSKKGKILFISIIILIIVAFFIFFQFKDSMENKKIENQKNLVANSKAVVYYSTTIDPSKRESIANFISKDNQVSPYYMDGLELGSVAYSPEDQTILLEDKYTLKFVTNNGMTSKKFKNPEYTGIKTGYLTKGHTFYSMNNTGIQEFNGAGYYSTIRYGNEQYVDSTLIEEWVQAVADNGMDTLYSLVCYVPSAEDGQKHRIVESTLTDDKKFDTTIIKELEEFEGLQNIEVIGNLTFKDGHLYSLLFYTDKNEVWKYDILFIAK